VFPLERDVALENRGGELFLAVEVVIERALGYSGRSQNLLQTCGAVAVLRISSRPTSMR